MSDRTYTQEEAEALLRLLTLISMIVVVCVFIAGVVIGMTLLP